MKSLTSAIEDLYAAFAGQAKPTTIRACPCCMTNDEVDVLVEKPLRELTSADLSSYSSSALLTVGDVPDYLYYLPRILEISIFDDFWWPDIEVSGKKIEVTNPRSWPANRRKAICSFFEAAIDHIIETKNYGRVDDWLCGIAATDFDLHSFLAKIEKNPDAVLEYFRANAKCLSEAKLCNAFWELPNSGHDEIVEWFRSARVSKILFDTYGYKM